MQILKEHYKSNNWAELLDKLQIKSECLSEVKENYASVRTAATRIQNKKGVKFSFKSSKENKTFKVWRIL